jgi:hypothetical protein
MAFTVYHCFVVLESNAADFGLVISAVASLDQLEVSVFGIKTMPGKGFVERNGIATEFGWATRQTIVDETSLRSLVRGVDVHPCVKSPSPARHLFLDSVT